MTDPTPRGSDRRDWARLLDGNRRTLSRAITAVENDRSEAREVMRTVRGHVGRARVIGVTGAPGTGKSTLINAYIRALRQRRQRVGVIAVDPSSPFSGGALLGDRIRMSSHSDDEGVFIRSLASRGHLGGVSKATWRVVDLMDAAGLDVVIVETVGTGQSEVEIMAVAETVILVCVPGLGDEIQAIKAGILEIADIVVVNKADLPLADRTAGQLREALAMSARDKRLVPIISTIATDGTGVGELIDAASRHHAELPADVRDNARRTRMRRRRWRCFGEPWRRSN
jgi:LAO/AO transport system ATPase